MRKANLIREKALVGGFLGGAYIAFGSLVAIAVSSGLDPKIWGTLPTLFTGAVFALGLILVVVAGAELLTGNMALLPIALLRKRITVGQLGVNFGLVLIGNLLGSLFVAYFLAYKTGVIGATADAAGSAGPRARPGGGARHRQGRDREQRADLPARHRLQLARLPRDLDGLQRRRTSAARSSRSSSRSWPSSRWASTTSSPTCSSCRSATSSARPASAGTTSPATW